VLRLHREAQFDEIEVISRHPLIGSHATDFAEASVTQFPMSFDTLDPVLHHEICGVDDLPPVLDVLGA
jgi:GTP 3',8-cyclase